MLRPMLDRIRHAPAVLLLAVAFGSAPLGGCAPKRVLERPEAAGDPGATRPTPLVRRQGTTQREVLPPPAADPAGPDPAVAPPGEEPAAEGSQLAIRAAGLALGQQGRPYRWGGDRPERGFDCSGLVQWSYRNVGVELPRVVRDQRRVGRSVEPRHLHPGDLVFFRLHGDRTAHVGIYVGGGQFVHAPRAGQPVRTDRLGDSYWRARWTDARRILDH
jgi:murein DD-endopeptidase